MNEQSQQPDADSKMWELLGRHQAVEPSIGFADRTLRRLHEEPAPRWYALPVWRWALVGATAVVVFTGLGLHQRATNLRRAEFYATTQRADYLDDYDVIASLDVLEAKSNL